MTVISHTPYALGMLAVNDAVIAEARRTIAYGISDTGWLEFKDVSPSDAFIRGVDHALKQKLERDDLHNYMHRPPYYPDRLQVWVCSSVEEYARIERSLGEALPALL